MTYEDSITVRIVRDRSLGTSNDLHHLHPSEVEVKMSDDTKAQLSCGDPCTNPILGGGPSRILYIHKKGEPNYSISLNEVQQIMNAVKTAFPSAVIASREDIVDMANADKPLCACGWVARSRQQQSAATLAAADLTTVYPSIPGTVGGCGGGQRAAISCGDAGPSWAAGKAGLFVKVDSRPDQNLETLRARLAETNVLFDNKAHISNLFDFNVGNFGASGPDKLFDGDIRSSYHNKYGGTYPYALEDHFVNLAVSPTAESRARRSTVSEIIVHHAHAAVSRAQGLRVEVRQGNRLLWQSTLRNAGAKTFVAIDPARQRENILRNSPVVSQQCLVACQEKCTGQTINPTCQAQCASLSTIPVPPQIQRWLAGAQKTTPWNDEGNGNASFLERHDLNCDTQAIQQFRLGRDGQGKYRYNYRCTQGAAFGTPTTSNTRPGTQSANVLSLGQYDVNCPSGSVLSKFKLSSGPQRCSEAQIIPAVRGPFGIVIMPETRIPGSCFVPQGYDITCRPSTVPLTCRNVQTPTDLNGGGNAIFLDRQNVSCAEDEAMAGFRLRQGSDPSHMYYEYRCCKPEEPKQPEPTTPLAGLISGTLPGSNLEIRNEIARFITCTPTTQQIPSATPAAPKPKSREEQLTDMLKDPNAAKAEVENMMAQCKAKNEAVFNACDECTRNSGNCQNEAQRNAVAARCEEAKRVHNPEACTARMNARKAELDNLTASLDAYCRTEYGTSCDKVVGGIRAGGGARWVRAGAVPSIPNELTIYYDKEPKDIVYGDKLLDYSEGEPDVDWTVGNEKISGQGGYGFLAKGYTMWKGKVANQYTGVVVSNGNAAEQKKWKERAVQDARYAFNFPMQFWPVRKLEEGLPPGAVLPSTTDPEQIAKFRVRTQMRTVNFEPKEMKRGVIDREDGWWGYWSKAEWLKASYAWAPIAAAGIAAGILHAGIWVGGAACTVAKGAAYAGCWTAMAGCEVARGAAYAGCGTALAACETARHAAYAGCWTAMAACKATNVGMIAAAAYDAICFAGNPSYPCNFGCGQRVWGVCVWPTHDWCRPQGFYSCRDSHVGQWLRQKERERDANCDANHESCKNGFARSTNCDGNHENCLNGFARNADCKGTQEKCLNDSARSMNCDVSSAHRWATKIVTDTADALWPHSRDADPDGLIGVEVSRFGTVAHFQARQNLPCLKRETNQIKCLPCEVNGGGEHECATLSTSKTIPGTWAAVFGNGTFKDGVDLGQSKDSAGNWSTPQTMNDLFPCPMPDFVQSRGAANIPHDIMSSIRIHSNNSKHTSISSHPYKVEAPGWAGPRCKYDNSTDPKTYLRADHCNEPVGTFENFFQGQRDTVDKNFYECTYKSGAVSTAQDLDKFVNYFKQGHVAECCDTDNCWYVPHNASIPFLQGMPQDFAANLVSNFHSTRVRKAVHLCTREKDAMIASIDDALGSARMDGAHGLLRTELRQLKNTILVKPTGTTCQVCGTE